MTGEALLGSSAHYTTSDGTGTVPHDIYGDAAATGGTEAVLEELRAKVANLEVALQTSRTIGTAIGIVMATYKLTEQRAFDVLKQISQTSHRKLRDIAEDVITSGTVEL